MGSVERVTVTIPDQLLKEIDRREKNRSKFFAEAVRRELDRQRRAELRRSLENPHTEIVELAGQGLEDWFRSLPEDDPAALLDMDAGTAVQWVPGKGWVEEGA